MPCIREVDASCYEPLIVVGWPAAARPGRLDSRYRPRCLPPSTLGRMSTMTTQSESLRAEIASHRDTLDVILRRYAATNPRLFGSVARGDATPDSDIDLLVDLIPGGATSCCESRGLPRS